MCSISKFMTVLSAAFLLSSCHYIKKPTFFDKRNKEYLCATSIQPLRIPPGTPSTVFHNEYPVPYRSYPPQAVHVSTKPPGL